MNIPMQMAMTLSLPATLSRSSGNDRDSSGIAPDSNTRIIPCRTRSVCAQSEFRDVSAWCPTQPEGYPIQQEGYPIQNEGFPIKDEYFPHQDKVNASVIQTSFEAKTDVNKPASTPRSFIKKPPCLQANVPISTGLGHCGMVVDGMQERQAHNHNPVHHQGDQMFHSAMDVSSGHTVANVAGIRREGVDIGFASEGLDVSSMVNGSRMDLVNGCFVNQLNKMSPSDIFSSNGGNGVDKTNDEDTNRSRNIVRSQFASRPGLFNHQGASKTISNDTSVSFSDSLCGAVNTQNSSTVNFSDINGTRGERFVDPSSGITYVQILDKEGNILDYEVVEQATNTKQQQSCVMTEFNDHTKGFCKNDSPQTTDEQVHGQASTISGHTKSDLESEVLQTSLVGIVHESSIVRTIGSVIESIQNDSGDNKSTNLPLPPPNEVFTPYHSANVISNINHHATPVGQHEGMGHLIIPPTNMCDPCDTNPDGQVQRIDSNNGKRILSDIEVPREKKVKLQSSVSTKQSKRPPVVDYSFVMEEVPCHTSMPIEVSHQEGSIDEKSMISDICSRTNQDIDVKPIDRNKQDKNVELEISPHLSESGIMDPKPSSVVNCSVEKDVEMGIDTHVKAETNDPCADSKDIMEPSLSINDFSAYQDEEGNVFYMNSEGVIMDSGGNIIQTDADGNIIPNVLQTDAIEESPCQSNQESEFTPYQDENGDIFYMSVDGTLMDVNGNIIQSDEKKCDVNVSDDISPQDLAQETSSLTICSGAPLGQNGDLTQSQENSLWTGPVYDQTGSGSVHVDPHTTVPSVDIIASEKSGDVVLVDSFQFSCPNPLNNKSSRLTIDTSPDICVDSEPKMREDGMGFGPDDMEFCPSSGQPACQNTNGSHKETSQPDSNSLIGKFGGSEMGLVKSSENEPVVPNVTPSHQNIDCFSVVDPPLQFSDPVVSREFLCDSRPVDVSEPAQRNPNNIGHASSHKFHTSKSIDSENFESTQGLSGNRCVDGLSPTSIQTDISVLSPSRDMSPTLSVVRSVEPLSIAVASPSVVGVSVLSLSKDGENPETAASTSIRQKVKAPPKTKPKDTKPKIVKLKGEEAEVRIRDYMKEQNRPYSAQIVFDNLHGVVPKAMVQSILEKLSTDGFLHRKEFGKALVYLVQQDIFGEVSPEENIALQQKVEELTEKKKTLAEMVDVRSRNQAIIRARAGLPVRLAEIKDRVLEKRAKVQASGVLDVDEMDQISRNRDQVEKSVVSATSQWKKWKKICMELVMTICDATEASKLDTLDMLGLDLDP